MCMASGMSSHTSPTSFSSIIKTPFSRFIASALLFKPPYALVRIVAARRGLEPPSQIVLLEPTRPHGYPFFNVCGVEDMVLFPVEEDYVVVSGELPRDRLCPASPVAPDYVVQKILLAEDLVHDGLHVVGHLPVEVDIDGAVVGEEISKEDEPLSKELDKARPLEPVIVGVHFAPGPEAETR